MNSSSALRLQIESALAHKIPSALTPAPRMVRPVTATGILALDDVLKGGLPVGALTELAGPEGSGRTSVALSLLAEMTRAAKVCAWIDVSDALDPGSAAAAGVDLSRMLWVRCGVAQPQKQPATHARHDFTLDPTYLEFRSAKQNLPGGGGGPHPRNEALGLSEAVSGLLQSPRLAGQAEVMALPEYKNISSFYTAPRCSQAQPGKHIPQPAPKPLHHCPALASSQHSATTVPAAPPRKPWSRMEQALRATDLLVQAGGFSAIILDMGSLPPEAVTRVPPGHMVSLSCGSRKNAVQHRAADSMRLRQEQCGAVAAAGTRTGPGRRSYCICRHAAQCGNRPQTIRRHSHQRCPHAQTAAAGQRP